MLILGIFDILSGAMLVNRLFSTGSVAIIFFVIFGLYLLIKFFIFRGDLASYIDLGAGLTLVVGLFLAPPAPLVLAFAGLVGWKGFKSIIG